MNMLNVMYLMHTKRKMCCEMLEKLFDCMKSEALISDRRVSPKTALPCNFGHFN